MLRTIKFEHEGCLEVRFVQSLARPAFLSLTIAALSGFALHFLPRFLSFRGPLNYAVDFVIGLAMPLFGFLFLFFSYGVIATIPRKKFFFHRAGIDVHTAILGISISKRWFADADIYGFGYGLAYHGGTPVLKFIAETEWIWMASPVTEEEVNEFVSFLTVKGYHYSTSRI